MLPGVGAKTLEVVSASAKPVRLGTIRGGRLIVTMEEPWVSCVNGWKESKTRPVHQRDWQGIFDYLRYYNRIKTFRFALNRQSLMTPPTTDRSVKPASVDGRPGAVQPAEPS